jgi:hypothetical protein
MLRKIWGSRGGGYEHWATSGFRRDADDTCALLGYYAASSSNPLPTFRDNLSVPSSRVKKSNEKKDVLILEDGTDRLSRNVGIELPTNTE